MMRRLMWVAAFMAMTGVSGASGQTLLERPVSELAQMVKDQEVTATALVEAAIARAKEVRSLNALILLDEEGALAAAKEIDAVIAAGGETKPLAGIPIVVKDNINIAGLTTTGGTPGLDFVPEASAPSAAQLQAAEAIVIGKANLHELAFGITSDNAAFGAVGNAVDPTKFAGGSSGGTAAAIAAGIVPAGLGTDTGGSVRIPAALNGIVGFRPTTWRYRQEGVVPISATRDVVGPMGRSVADVALLNSIMSGGTVLPASGLEGVTFGVATPHADNLSDGVAAVFEAAKEKLSAAGATLVDVDLSDIVAATGEAGFPIALFEAKRDLTAFLSEHQPATSIDDVVAEIASNDVKGIFLGPIMGEDAVPTSVYVDAVGSVDTIRANYIALMNENGLDAVIFPTTPLEAQPIEGSGETVSLNGEDVPTFPTFIRNTDPASIYGAPGLSIPMGETAQGLPVGLEMDGRPDGDLDLLSLGIAVEAALQQ